MLFLAALPDYLVHDVWIRQCARRFCLQDSVCLGAEVFATITLLENLHLDLDVRASLLLLFKAIQQGSFVESKDNLTKVAGLTSCSRSSHICVTVAGWLYHTPPSGLTSGSLSAAHRVHFSLSASTLASSHTSFAFLAFFLLSSPPFQSVPTKGKVILSVQSRLW